MIKLCVSILKDGTFLDKDPAELTISIIGCARKAGGLKNSMYNYFFYNIVLNV